MNIINAIMNLVQNPVTQLVHYYQGQNRANNAGDALEEYIKDLFANSFNMPETKRLEYINAVFSYLGNNSNPPDAMLRAGDAIEVKKIESNNAALALNSSYPKHTVLASSPMISSACKFAEDWIEKDIIYVVGVVKQNCLKHLCMVYGLDYCASDECYSRIKSIIKNGVEAINGVEFAESRELGHINKVDPLGITYIVFVVCGELKIHGRFLIMSILVICQKNLHLCVLLMKQNGILLTIQQNCLLWHTRYHN